MTSFRGPRATVLEGHCGLFLPYATCNGKLEINGRTRFITLCSLPCGCGKNGFFCPLFELDACDKPVFVTVSD